MDTFTWYSQLIKPSWAPPSRLFGPVWTVLYAIIAVSFGTVFYKTFTGKLPWIIALPFALNLIFNFAFTPLQFGWFSVRSFGRFILFGTPHLNSAGSSMPTFHICSGFHSRQFCN